MTAPQDAEPLSIDLGSPLTRAHAWRFPLQTKASRRDIVIGALWLLVPGVGWLMNMGHRVRFVHRLQRGEAPWPAWEKPGELLKHGTLTALGMLWYGAPGLAAIALGMGYASPMAMFAGAALLAVAFTAIPGYMSHYCRDFDPREIFNPVRALSRVREGGLDYWRAWSIVLPTMLASFLGLLGLGIGFLFTSVWFWQAAAFCFATVFTKRFHLDKEPGTEP